MKRNRPRLCRRARQRKILKQQWSRFNRAWFGSANYATYQMERRLEHGAGIPQRQRATFLGALLKVWRKPAQWRALDFHVRRAMLWLAVWEEGITMNTLRLFFLRRPRTLYRRGIDRRLLRRRSR